jgi:hypothetical protein
MGEPVSDRREDDEEPVSIEADAPEADWIEQHQPIVDDADDDPYRSEVAEDDAEPVSIEADAPEADWIEQHQPIVDEADDDRVSSPVLENEADAHGDYFVDDEPSFETPTQFPEDASGDEPDERAGASERAGARGCNLIGVLVHALMHSARDAARRIPRGNTRSAR